MRILVLIAALIAGCDAKQTPAEKAGIKFLGYEDPAQRAPATFTHYQLYPVNASYAWRLNVETGDVHLCAAGTQRGICFQFAVQN